jgi:protocatechuate 3,4-dioxygenase beta subunit
MRNVGIALALLVLVLGLAASSMFLFDADQGADSGVEQQAAIGLEKDAPVPGELTQVELDASPTSSGTRTASSVQPERAVEPERAAPRSKRGVRGRVVDEFGSPVASARVFYSSDPGVPGARIDLREEGALFGAPVEETETAADGTFALEFDRRGDLSLAVRHAGFAPLRETRELAADGATELEDLVLERGVTIAGHVVDSAGVGVAGAKLYDLGPQQQGMFFALSGGRPIAVTDESGAFLIDELQAGPYRLRVDHDEHPAIVAEGNVPRAGDRKVGERYQLEDGFEIAGRVLGLESGQSREVQVRAQPAQEDFEARLAGLGGGRLANVEPDGTFLLKGLREGQGYRVSAVESDAQGPGPWFAESRSTVSIAKAGERDVRLELRASTSLVFQVVADDTGEPLTEFGVEAGAPWMQPLMDAENKQVKQHADGRVRYVDVPMQGGATDANLRISAVGYRTYVQKGISLERGGEVDLGVLRLAPAPVVTVVVTDAKSGAPIKNARVSLRPVQDRPQRGMVRSVSATGVFGADSDEEFPELGFPGEDSRAGRTDAEGRARISSLPGKLVTLRVEEKNHADHESDPVTLSMTEDQEFAVELRMGGTVIVHVVDSRGEPLKGVRVQHSAPGGNPDMIFFGGGDQEKSRGDGTVTYRNLEQGAHHFQLSEQAGAMFGNISIAIEGMPGEAPVERPGEEVLVTEGSVTEITLRASPRGSLVGTVTEGGQPLAGASISFEERREAETGGGFGGAGFVDFPGFGGGGPSAKTDGKGRYEVDSLKVGEYTARVSHPTRAMRATFEVTVVEGRQSCDFPLSITVIEGHVLDEQGRGVAGVEVRAERAQDPSFSGRMVMSSVVVSSGGGGTMMIGGEAPGAKTLTNAEGFYSLRGVEPDQDLYVASTSPKHEDGKSEDVIVSEGETRSGVDIRVVGAGRIEVQAQEASGAPASFVMVHGQFQGQSESSVDDVREFAPEGGMVTLSGLRAGLWKLTAIRMGPGSSSESEPVLVEVSAGEDGKATLVLP